MGSLLPALSSALKKTVVVPSAVIPTEPPAPLIVCVPAWAPKRVTTMSFTPEPPGLSVAASASVTSWLFQPEALAAGDGAAVVVGGVVSLGWTKNSRLFDTMSNCWRPAVPASELMLRRDLPLNSILQSLMMEPAA